MSHDTVDPALIAEKLGHIKRKYVVLSGKGGVGKSTVSVNLAVCLALSGKNTGLLDIDLHGPSVPKMLGLESFKSWGDEKTLYPAEKYEGRLKVMSTQFFLKNTNDAVIWRGPMKHGIISQFVGLTVWGDLDYLVIDSPPGTGDEPLSVMQTVKPDGAIIITTPQTVATFDVVKSIDFCRRLELPIMGVIENMSGFVCPHCGKTTDIFSSGGGKKLAADENVPFLGSIPIDPGFVSLSDSGKVFVEANSKSAVSEAMFKIASLL